MRNGAVFYKMTGSGNDFVVFDGRHSRFADFTPEAVRAVCDRRHGVGADGVILLDPQAPEDAHFVFHFWNSDGSRGPMCGNGALCATHLATLIELAPSEGEVRFSTASGIHRGRVCDGRPELYLPDCGAPRRLPEAAVTGAEETAWLVHPSVPHLVVPVPDVATVPLTERGPALRHDPAIGSGGANVNWVSPVGDGTWRMRTYERGVEGETLACATGAVACGLVLEELGRARPPVRFWTRSGRPLEISWARDGNTVTGIRLSGEGRVVFRGVLGELPTADKTEA
jgi:diaminopimelate epimerase